MHLLRAFINYSSPVHVECKVSGTLPTYRRPGKDEVTHIRRETLLLAKGLGRSRKFNPKIRADIHVKTDNSVQTVNRAWENSQIENAQI